MRESTPLLHSTWQIRRRRSNESSEEDPCKIQIVSGFSHGPSQTITTTAPSSDNIAALPTPEIQFVILAFIQLAASLSFAVVLPFVNFAVYRSGVAGDDFANVGFWSAIVQLSFFLGEAVWLVPSHFLSNRYGRKPFLLVSLVGMVVTSVIGGFNKPYWGLIVIRALAGAVNVTTTVAAKSMAELCLGDIERLFRKSVYIAISGEAGSILGLLVGGMLVHVSDISSAQDSFEMRHLFFIPFMTAACFAGLSIALTLTLIEESLPAPAPDNEILVVPYSPITGPRRPRPSIFSNSILSSIINYGLLSLIEVGFWSIFALFLSTPITQGGLGLLPGHVGLIMGATGLVNMIFQLLVSRRIQNSAGSKSLLSMCMACYGVSFALFPVINEQAVKSGGESPTVWAALGIQLALVVVGSMAYSSVFEFIESATRLENLTAVNFMAQLTSLICKAIGCGGLASIFAVSIQQNLLGGNLVYIVGGVLGLIGMLAGGFLEEKKGFA